MTLETETYIIDNNVLEFRSVEVEELIEGFLNCYANEEHIGQIQPSGTKFFWIIFNNLKFPIKEDFILGEVDTIEEAKTNFKALITRAS